MTNELRVELRTRNNRLWHAIFDNYKNVAEFCKAHGFQQSAVGALLNLKLGPYISSTSNVWIGRLGKPTKLAVKIADAVKMPVEELFPPDLYGGNVPREMVAEIPSNMLRGIEAAKMLALPAAQEDAINANDRRRLLDAALATMPPRDALVLRARFGLDGQDEDTLETLAGKMGITKERVRQLELRAIRRMRHPSRANKLKAAL